jgi:tryptophan synthase beta subunit
MRFIEVQVSLSDFDLKRIELKGDNAEARKHLTSLRVQSVAIYEGDITKNNPKETGQRLYSSTVRFGIDCNGVGT